MLVTASVLYHCGGYPYPTYQGSLDIGLNIHAEATDEQIYEELIRRAIKKAADKMCFSPQLVQVDDVTEICYQK